MAQIIYLVVGILLIINVILDIIIKRYKTETSMLVSFLLFLVALSTAVVVRDHIVISLLTPLFCVMGLLLVLTRLRERLKGIEDDIKEIKNKLN